MFIFRCILIVASATFLISHRDLVLASNLIPAAPNKRAGKTLQQANNMTTASTHRSNSKFDPKVRFGVRLTPFKMFSVRDKLGKKLQKFQKLRPLQHTLRARMTKTNHFYLGRFHLETVPVNWIKQANLYKLKIKVSKRFGAHGMLEEHIGNIFLEGKLSGGNGDIYVLNGVATKVFMNKQQHPELELVAGFTNQRMAKAVSKKPVSRNPIPLINKNSKTEPKRGVVNRDKLPKAPANTKPNPWKK